MFKKHMAFWIVIVLFVGVVSLLPSPAESNSLLPQNQGGFDYAQLIVQGDLVREGDAGIRVRWIQGEKNLVPQFVTVESLNRLLSRKATFSNFGALLDTIGDQSWELVDVRTSSNALEYWAFKRAR